MQEQACGALANLGVNQQNMVEIAQLSGIELVISSLKKFPTEPGVQENGCFALSKFLTMPNESYRQRMKQADAEAALEVIKNSKPSFDVKICCNVLLRRLGEEAKAGAPPPGQASAGWTGPPPGTMGPGPMGPPGGPPSMGMGPGPGPGMGPPGMGPPGMGAPMGMGMSGQQVMQTQVQWQKGSMPPGQMPFGGGPGPGPKGMPGKGPMPGKGMPPGPGPKGMPGKGAKGYGKM